MESGANYYQLLGVPRDATQGDIKVAYRELVRIFHPDSNYYDEILDSQPGGVGAERPDHVDALFKRIVAAYEVLSNQELRQQYDEKLPKGLMGWDDALADSETYLEKVRAVVRANGQRQAHFGQAPTFQETQQKSRANGMERIISKQGVIGRFRSLVAKLWF